MFRFECICNPNATTLRLVPLSRQQTDASMEFRPQIFAPYGHFKQKKRPRYIQRGVFDYWLRE